MTTLAFGYIEVIAVNAIIGLLTIRKWKMVLHADAYHVTSK